jgi:hypothetical protein
MNTVRVYDFKTRETREIPAQELSPSYVRVTAGKLDAVYRCYMASELWKANRAPAVERATDPRGEMHCERCRCKRDALEVHHLTYERFTRELPGDLLALCAPCHDKADVERREAWQRQLSRWRAEAHAEHEKARFAGWLRKVKGIESDEVGADLDWLREEYDEWCRDREGDDRE